MIFRPFILLESQRDTIKRHDIKYAIENGRETYAMVKFMKYLPIHTYVHMPNDVYIYKFVFAVGMCEFVSVWLYHSMAISRNKRNSLIHMEINHSGCWSFTFIVQIKIHNFAALKTAYNTEFMPHYVTQSFIQFYDRNMN